MKRHIQKSTLIFSTLFLFIIAVMSVQAQDETTEDLTQTREITSDAFTKKRPVASGNSKKRTNTGRQIKRQRVKRFINCAESRCRVVRENRLWRQIRRHRRKPNHRKSKLRKSKHRLSNNWELRCGGFAPKNQRTRARGF